MKVLVGDLLHDEDLRPDISGMDRVSTVMSELELSDKSSLLGLSGLCKLQILEAYDNKLLPTKLLSLSGVPGSTNNSGESVRKYFSVSSLS